MNQYYSEELSQKTKRGLNESRLKGNFCGGKINYGYSLLPIYAEENGKKVFVTHKIILNEDEAPIVREIFTEYANGKSVCQIVKDLNARGLKNRGNPFITSTLYTMLKREKYTGVYRINGNIYTNLYPAIVPVDIYEIVRKRLEKELEKTEKAIVNIMTAIKMGIITETTKESLEECENTKRELTAKLFDARAKEKPRPSRDEIRKYIRTALKKPTQQMIDLLIHKVVVFNDKIEITFKYVKGSPTDERPKKLNKHLTKNMSLDTSRGSLFMSYEYPYTETKHYVTYDKVYTVELYV